MLISKRNINVFVEKYKEGLYESLKQNLYSVNSVLRPIKTNIKTYKNSKSNHEHPFFHPLLDTSILSSHIYLSVKQT